MSINTDAVTGYDESELADFDAFWEGQNRKGKPVKIMGELVHLPPSLPLQFELEARKLQRSKREKDMRKLVGILFGPDALARWSEKGMDLEQFMVLLAWAPQVVAGKNVSIAEVAAEVAAANAPGKDAADPS